MSGTVSGLNGNGLVLAVNGGQLTVASGATTVTLASGLSTGSAYTVSVQTQPAGESCTVANGIGTIAAANVANVVVTCATHSFALGGTISGLNGSGLVLANGTNQVAVSSGATTFTLPAQVAYGSSYAVMVSTQPAGLACAVSNGSGTMPAAAVTTIAVSCNDLPFSVGGTIIGLGTNAGLVLKNGSDSLTVAAGSTSFTMPTAVAFGSTYAVAVQSSPAGLVCSVSAGTGTVGAANVTSVVVTCSDVAYNLSGTVSGLAASGLVLSSGTDQLAVPSGATGFTMPTPVAFGSAYNVQVTTQPTGELCSLANASGTMPAHPVTSVAVTCSVATYTIGGSISGLTASGLVLLDSGGDATSIAANATQFTMHTGVAYGGSYAITIRTQPRGETCQISQASGTNITADVTTVMVSCAPWSTFTTSVLYSFRGGTSDGSEPDDSLIQGTDGFLYGNTNTGGAYGNGTVFKLSTAEAETLLYSFGTIAADAINPFSALIQGADGNLYGTTGGGGQYGDGTLYEVMTGGAPPGMESVVYPFGGVTGDGSHPNGVFQAGDGNFYGTTASGGANGAGTVYRITPSGSETLLYSFGAAGDGSYPEARLYQGSDGSLYGTTSAGGAYGGGTVFKITTGGVYTLLYSFGGYLTDGTMPLSSLIQASDGNFYGTTYTGGTNNLGTVYQVTPAGVETVLYSFGTNPNDGTLPFTRLLQGSDGSLYGTTPGGGSTGDGVVFRVTLAGAETLIYTFTGVGSDGAYPQNALIQGSDGIFYSTTLNGGSSNQGTVFKIIPQ